MILVIDNYDSFTWNLVHYLMELGAEVEVVRNDEVSIADIEARRPDRLVVSPGPCSPAEAGISVSVAALAANPAALRHRIIRANIF